MDKDRLKIQLYLIIFQIKNHRPTKIKAMVFTPYRIPIKILMGLVSLTHN
jgi:hypothetical protein